MGLLVWAPGATSVAVRLRGAEHDLGRAGMGMWAADVPARPGDDYLLVLDGECALPDPCSRCQPEGLCGPSRIVEPGAFAWTDGEWAGLTLDELVLYELHVGTFTPESTFEAVIPHLAGLRELGVTAIELMPVATFPGDRGWGYDGVYTSARHRAYGGPEGLARLVDAAHAAGLGVVLDVVYNHLGPRAEAIAVFGPYFTDRYRTFWGQAFDDARPAVREWAIQNACPWVRDYHVDGLRLDATHAVFDESPTHVLAELAERVRQAAPSALVTSELVAPQTPLLFMGQEYGERAPFQFFTDHLDPAVAEATREGRRREFAGFSGFAAADVPDSQAPATFERSRLTRDGNHELRVFDAELLRLRRELPRTIDVRVEGDVLHARRGGVELVADFGRLTAELRR